LKHMVANVVCISDFANKEKKMSKRNPIAKNLRTPLYRKRVVKSKKIYNRKKKEVKHEEKKASV